ncbi:unnamed protein product, partial [Sphenostylis stenocarpa]
NNVDDVKESVLVDKINKLKLFGKEIQSKDFVEEIIELVAEIEAQPKEWITS